MAEHLQPSPMARSDYGTCRRASAARSWWAWLARWGRRLCFFPDGKWLYAALGETAALGRPFGRARRHSLSQAKDMNAIPFALNPDGKVLAASGAGNVVQLWDPETGDLYRQSLTVRGEPISHSHLTAGPWQLLK